MNSHQFSQNLVHSAIENAELLQDPLADLVARTKADPGSPFDPETLKELSLLKVHDEASYKSLRNELKKSGFRIAEFDKAIAKSMDSTSERRPTQAEILLNLASDLELFHTTDYVAYGDIDVDGHRETWPIQRNGFKRWLRQRYYEETQGAPNSEAMKSALNTIEARAHFGFPQHDVYLRTAHYDGKLYLDLTNESWQAVEIDEIGWRVIPKPPVRFRRTDSMLPLPFPKQGGSLKSLRPFLNVGDDEFVLVIAWALAVLRDYGPYPVLVVSGEPGSAKSTFSRILCSILDPNSSPLHTLPRNDQDLFISATNQHLLAFDNLSGLAPWISDAFCRISSGGGFAVRKLFTDEDEMIFNAQRPILLNGIEDVVTRSDLADRAIYLHLNPIEEEQRRPEHEIWQEFENARPMVLGALLDAVSLGLRHLPDTELSTYPRMADFARWVAACETAFFPVGTFLRAYGSNRNDVIENVLEADPVAQAIRSLMDKRIDWSGTATDLLTDLSDTAGERTRKNRSWPANARSLSGRLHRICPFLRKIGILIEFKKEGRKRTRMIYISREPENEDKSASAASAASEGDDNRMPLSGLNGSLSRTQKGLADANDCAQNDLSVCVDASNSQVADGADGADAKHQ